MIRQSYPIGGLLGGAQGGLLGANAQQSGAPVNTQDMMQQYLQGLYMRRYNPPAVSGPGVTSQMGPGGMQYRPPAAAPAAPAQQTNPLAAFMGGAGGQQDAQLMDWMRKQYAYLMSGGG